MCPSILGRIETRTTTLIGPALLALLLGLLQDTEGYLVVLGIYYLIGVALDTTLYALVIKWQPPWLTFVLGLGEFVIVYVLAVGLDVPLKPIEAIWFYWASWVMAVWTRIVILPIVSLTWIESAGEFRRTDWTTLDEDMPMPILAEVDATRGAGGLLREFSSVDHLPAELRSVPAPSGVHERQPVPR